MTYLWDLAEVVLASLPSFHVLYHLSVHSLNSFIIGAFLHLKTPLFHPLTFLHTLVTTTRQTRAYRLSHTSSLRFTCQPPLPPWLPLLHAAFLALA